MTIADNRTLISAADAQGSWVDLANGTMNATAASNNFIEGTGSIEGRSSKSTDGIFWDYGSTQDFTDVVFYFWANMAAASLLDLKANQGLTMRFTGASQADFFEINVAGSDTYGGGWKMFVVDASVAKTASDNTGGTPPAVTAVQFVGIVVTTTATAPGSDPNFFVDSSWSLAAATPGIIIAGQNAAAAWTIADLVAAADPADVNKAWGTVTALPNGTVSINTPIQFGLNDATQDEFEDTNQVLGWEVADVPDGFYGFSIVAGTGQNDVTWGIKSGTGDTATGAQGFVVTTGGPRWFIDFDDANIDALGLYGCSLIGGGDFLMGVSTVDVVSTVYIDCTSAAVHNSNQLRNTIVAANTATGVAFMTTDDLADIIFCAFAFSVGHAIELDAATPTAQTNKGNTFSGYTNSVDSLSAAILNSAAGALTITNSDGANLETSSYRNTGGGSVSVVAGVTITLTFLDDDTGSVIEGLSVVLGTAPGLVDVIDNLLTNASGVVTTSYTGSVPDVVEGFGAKGSEEITYKRRAIGGTVAAGTGLAATIRMTPD